MIMSPILIIIIIYYNDPIYYGIPIIIIILLILISPIFQCVNPPSLRLQQRIPRVCGRKAGEFRWFFRQDGLR